MNYKDYGIGERELKFRAWSKSFKGIGNVYEIDLEPEFAESVCMDNLGSAPCLHMTEPRKDVVLMQYTGLKDKNGKEIYEGDIVCPHYSVKTSWPVYFDRGRWLAGKDEMSLWSNVVEIIGNIFENSELLTPNNKEDE